MAVMNIQIQGDYGYVILVVVSGFVVLNYLGMRVMGARKKYNVRPPTMYSDTSDEFNCYQRGHQNALESFPIFLALLIFGGVQFPKMSALCGVIYLAGKVVYAHGYYTGNPAKRTRGSFAYIGILLLIIFNIIFAFNLLGFI